MREDATYVARAATSAARRSKSTAASSVLCTVMSLAASVTTWAADEQPSDGDALQQVVVTAQYRRENLQNTALAITAVSGQQLEQQGLDNVTDLGNVIPNANIRPQGTAYGPTPMIGMRGVETNDFIYTTDPGVGIYIDDVYQGSLAGSALDLLDLERVEVLRGPQGTLFGKNSLGGAIRLISKKPEGSNSGNVEVTYGTYNTINVKASYDVALGDHLFMRVAGLSKHIDGYQDVVDFTCQMKANGTPQLAGNFPTLVPSNLESEGNCKTGENGGSSTQGARIMLRYVPTDDLEVGLSADYTHTDGEAQATSKLSPDLPSDVINNVYQNAVILPRFGIAYNADSRFVPSSPFVTYGESYDPVNGHSFPPGETLDAKDAAATLGYRIAPGLRLDVIAGYRQYESDFFANQEEMPIELASQYNLTHHEQESLEMRFSGSLIENRLDWTTGLYQYNDQSHLGGFVALPAFQFLGILPSFNQNDHFTTRSSSGFVHGIFKITDQWSFTAGGRYTHERKTYAFDHSPYLLIPGELHYGSNHFDWKLSTDYRFNDEVMVYSTISTGFRSDGAQPRPFTPGQQHVPTPAEKLISYEIGTKTDLLDRHLRVNVAAFVDSYSPRVTTEISTQCNAASDLNPGTPYQGITASNPCPAGTALAGTTGIPWIWYTSAPGRDGGVELELTANVIEGLSVDGTLSYFTFHSRAPATIHGAPNPAYVDPSYKEQAPISGSLGAQYRMVVRGGALTPRLDWFYQGYRSNGPEPYLPQLPGSANKVPGYGLVNGRLTYEPANSKWTAAVSAENLLNKFYWYQLGAERDNLTGDVIENRQGAPARGRVVSLTLSRRFE
ncbi:MAG TPA: TonB-dependent receptor [Steroidobacteraceae bacterium]|nr:TonB-dependent receptor [Steroidobacteraceae bacterium]